MRFPTILASLAFAVACTNAENAPAKPAKPMAASVAGPSMAAPAAPAPAVVPVTKMDFTIPLTPLKQKDLNFQLYRNRWSLHFYFMPTCGHCQHTYPWIQKLRATYEKKGLAFAAIVSGSSSLDDVQMFDTDFKLDVPAFQDATRKYGQVYGTGSVPLIVLVKPDGSFQSWTGSDDTAKVAIEKAIKAGLHIK